MLALTLVAMLVELMVSRTALRKVRWMVEELVVHSVAMMVWLKASQMVLQWLELRLVGPLSGQNLDLWSAQKLTSTLKSVKPSKQAAPHCVPTVTVELSVVADTCWMLPAMSVAIIANVTMLEVGTDVGMAEVGTEVGDVEVGSGEGEADG